MPALIGRAIGMAGSLRGLGRIARHVLRRGGHLVHSGGDQFDLGQLRLHALVGTDGDVGGVLGRIADLLHRADHLADHALQACQERIETGGDLAQLVATVDVQALGQVTFALADVVQHHHHVAQRTGDAPADQPDGQQTGNGDEHADDQHGGQTAAAFRAECRHQLIQILHHLGDRQLQHQDPARVGTFEGERQEQCDVPSCLVDLVMALPGWQALDQHLLLGIENLCCRLANQALVSAVGSQAAVVGNQRDLADAAIELRVGVAQQLLDEVDTDVRANDAVKLAIDQNGGIERGKKVGLAVHVIRCRVADAWLELFARAQVVLAGAYPGVEQPGVFDVGEAVDLHLAAAIAVDPAGEATVEHARLVAAIHQVVRIHAVRFPGDIGAGEIGVLDQRLAREIDQLLAPEVGHRHAVITGQCGERMHPGQAGGDLQGRLQLCLDAVDLCLSQGGDALLHHAVDQRASPLLDQRLAAHARRQCIEQQRRDDGQGAGAGQCGEGGLDGSEHGVTPVAQRIATLSAGFATTAAGRPVACPIGPI